MRIAGDGKPKQKKIDASDQHPKTGQQVIVHGGFNPARYYDKSEIDDMKYWAFNGVDTLSPVNENVDTLAFPNGLSVIGGSSNDESINIYANNGTWNSDQEGKIYLRDPVILEMDDGDVTLQNTFVPPFFNSANLALIEATGIVRTTGTIASNQMILASHTFAHTAGQFLGSAPTFQAGNTVRYDGTGGGSDALTPWVGFLNTLRFENNSSGAGTRTLTDLGGFASILSVSQSDTANAAALTVINDLSHFVANVIGNLAPIIEDSSVTITNLQGLLVREPDNSLGGTITNSRGIAIAEQTVGTNNVDILTGTTTSPPGDWGGYFASTDPYYFGGNVGFNGATPAAPPDYTVSNHSTLRTLDASSYTMEDLTDLVLTLVSDLTSIGLLQ